jgi:hypothetical protein
MWPRKRENKKRYIRENSAIQVQQQEERLPVSGAFFILGCDRLFVCFLCCWKKQTGHRTERQALLLPTGLLIDIERDA